MRQRSEAINGLLVFLIYGMFALFALFLVVIGARVYKNVVTTGDSNAAVRTGFCYMSAFSMEDDGAGGLCLSAAAPDGLSRSMRLSCLEQEGEP